MRKSIRNLYIGTSGWMYKDWHKDFYPEDMKKGFLTYLSTVFPTVEINSSFYHLPEHSTFKKWYSEVPADFRFAVKMNRYITHRKMLKGVKREVGRFLKAAIVLKEKLGVVLIQLPPRLVYKKEKLNKLLADIESFCDDNKIKIRFALEPRHKSWFAKENIEEILVICKKYKICLVFAHSSRFPFYEPSDDLITSDFIYLRFHGPREFASSLYGPEDLKNWVPLINKWLKKKMTVFVYFNNDIHGYAVKDAKTLVELFK